MAGKFKVLIVWILCLGSLALQAQQNFNCFTIVAGKKATADGSVLLAHNEDDYAEGMEIFSMFIRFLPRKLMWLYRIKVKKLKMLRAILRIYGLKCRVCTSATVI